MFLSAGQTSDYIGARALLPSIPKAAVLLGDRGYDADWFRNALIEMGISPCIPSRAGRKAPIQHDADLYRLRHKIENMFARLKDWRRVATRYDRCPMPDPVPLGLRPRCNRHLLVVSPDSRPGHNYARPG